MKQGQVDETRLVEYLLGETGPDERAEIEERYIADPDFLADVQAVERDLIDQYVRGELTNQTAFETHFLASPARRERVEFARALMHASVPVAVVAQRPSGRYRPWQLAAAAALVLVIGGWLLISNRPTMDQQSAGAQPPGGATGSPTPPVVAPPDSPTIPPSSTPALRIVTLMLSSTAIRGSGAAPTLVVGDATDVQFQLELEAVSYPSYRAVIRTADGVEVARQDGLKSQSINDRPAVIVNVAANRFGADDYTITLSGLTPSGEAEELGGYYFRARLTDRERR